MPSNLSQDYRGDVDATVDAPVVHGVCFIGVMIALFSHAAAYIPVPIGLWSDSEPIGAAVHLGGAIAAAGLAGFSWSQKAVVLTAFPKIVTTTALLLAVWSLVGALFARDIGLALVGSPQTGEGPVLFFNFAVLFLAAAVLARSPGFRVALGIGLAAASVAAPLLAVLADIRVYFFDDWLLPIAICAPAACLLLIRERMGRFLGLAIAFLLFAVLTGVTANRTALMVAPLVILSLIALTWPGRFEKGFWLPLLAGTAAALPVVLWAALQLLAEVMWVESLWSRAHLHHMLLTELIDRPWAILVGSGWGHLPDVVARSLTTAGTPIWDVENWDLLRRDIVDAHHVGLNSVIMGGLPAAGLRLLLLAALPLAASPRHRPAAGFIAVALAVYDSLWFRLPDVLPVIAVAYAALVESRDRRERWRAGRRWVARTGLASVAVLSAVLTVGLIADGAAIAPHRDDTSDPGMIVRAVAAGEVPGAGLRRSLYAAELLSLAAHHWRRHPDPKPDVIVTDLLTITELPADLRSPRLLFVSLVWVGEILHHRPHIVDPSMVARWRQAVVRSLSEAPRRSDLAAAYLSWLHKAGRYADVIKEAERLFRGRLHDPIRLWYAGAAMTHLGDPQRRQAGLQLMRRALSENVGLLIKIDSALVAQVRAETHP